MTPIQIPAARQPVIEQGPGNVPLFTRVWWLFMQQLFQRVGNSGEAATAIAVGASPYSFTSETDANIVVTGGTVSAIAYGRNGVFTTLGITTGVVPVFAGDAVRVTYTALPTMTQIKR